jgi:hypothetical protein
VFRFLGQKILRMGTGNASAFFFAVQQRNRIIKMAMGRGERVFFLILGKKRY